VLGVFGLLYVGLVHVAGIPEAGALVSRITRRARR
jgi:hypothetical protein